MDQFGFKGLLPHLPLVSVPSNTGTVKATLVVLIPQFGEWSTRLQGGAKKEKNIAQQCQQIRVLLDTVDDCLFSFDCITSHHTLSDPILTNFVELEFSKPDGTKWKKSPSTMKNYLLSFIKFLDFLRIKRPVLNINLEEVRTFIREVQLWIHGFHESLKVQIIKRQLADQENPITPELIAKYETSPYAMAAKELMLDLPHKLTAVNHARITNYIIMQFLLSNACRPGIVRELTIAATRLGMMNVIGSRHVFTVIGGKTIRIRGESNVAVEPSVANHLAQYTDEVRTRIPAFTKEHVKDKSDVFLTWNGFPLVIPYVSHRRGRDDVSKPGLQCHCQQISEGCSESSPNPRRRGKGKVGHAHVTLA
jgi:hypothetical protein